MLDFQCNFIEILVVILEVRFKVQQYGKNLIQLGTQHFRCWLWSDVARIAASCAAKIDVADRALQYLL